MTQPTFSSAKNAYFQLAGYDLSEYLNTVDLDDRLAALKSTTFVETAETYIAGLKDATINLAAHADQNASYLLTKLYEAKAAGVVTYIYGPQGNTSTWSKFTGSALVTNIKTGSKPDGMVEVGGVTLQCTGAVTLGAF